MKKIYFTLFVLIIFSINSSAQQDEFNRLKTNLYYDIFDSLLISKNLDEFVYKLNQVNFEKEPPVNSKDNRQSSIMINLPDDEKIIIAYENSTGKTFRVIFIHHSTIYDNIKSYLNNEMLYSSNHDLWYSPSKKFILSYELENSELAVLNVYNADYNW